MTGESEKVPPVLENTGTPPQLVTVTSYWDPPAARQHDISLRPPPQLVTMTSYAPVCEWLPESHGPERGGCSWLPGGFDRRGVGEE